MSNKLFYNTNRHPGKHTGEVNNEPSMTVPGETYTIGQIMERMIAGNPPEERFTDFLDVEDINLIDKYFAPGALDLTDLQELVERNTQMQNAIQAGIAKWEKEKIDRENEERILEKHREAKKAAEAKNPPRSTETGQFIDDHEHPHDGD